MKLLTIFKKVKTQSDKMSEDMANTIIKKITEDDKLASSIAQKVVVSIGPIIEKAIKEAVEMEMKKTNTVK